MNEGGKLFPSPAAVASATLDLAYAEWPSARAQTEEVLSRHGIARIPDGNVELGAEPTEQYASTLFGDPVDMLVNKENGRLQGVDLFVYGSLAANDPATERGFHELIGSLESRLGRPTTIYGSGWANLRLWDRASVTQVGISCYSARDSVVQISVQRVDGRR